jgi:hypothetical protein
MSQDRRHGCMDGVIRSVGPRSWSRLAALAAGILAISQLRAADTPQEYVDAVRRAETAGTALYEAQAKGATPDERIVALAKGRINSVCDFQYVPVQVKEDGEMVLYLLAQSREPTDVIIGQHFKITEATVEPSSKSCLNLHSGPKKAVAMFVTHLLTPTPSEFHVYLTLKHKIGLYVGTSAGDWLVKNGAITFLNARAPAPLK